MNRKSIGSCGAAGLLGALLTNLISPATIDTTVTFDQAANAVGAGAAIEAQIAGGDALLGTINIAGVNIDANAAIISTPAGLQLTVADVVGAPLPGRTLPGLVGTTAMANVNPTLLGAQAIDVQVDPAHNLIIGPLTRNDPNGTGPGGRSFEVMGVPIAVAVDPRLDPFQALLGGSIPVDLATVPLGSLVEVNGYPGDDGQFYTTLIVTDLGTPATGGTAFIIGVERARCRQGDLGVRGVFSSTTGTVEILDENGLVVATAPVDPLDGTFAARARVNNCPGTIRARHVETGTISDPFPVAAR